MQLVLLACLAAVAVAAPQLDPNPELAEILSDVREDSGDGNFKYSFETSNGISQSVSGYPGEKGQSNMQGSFSFPLDDGSLASYTFVADENGYQPESDLIPVAPPLPPHVIELLKIVEQLKAQGAKWDDLGRRIDV